MDKFEDLTLEYNEKGKKLTKNLMDNIGLIMGAVICMAVIVIMTTDLRLISAREAASVGLEFFLLIFCSYSMYICCADTGTKKGLASTSYTDAKKRIDTLKKGIVTARVQARLSDFCKHYTEEELKSTMTYKLSTVGIDYDTYAKEYMYKDDKDIDKVESLSNLQKKVIKETNTITPIRLTPEMLMGGMREKVRRPPLEMNPRTAKSYEFALEFFKISLVSVLMSVIAFDVVTDPSWTIFASVCMKLVSIITNGFSGYKTGYENIVIDTTNYIESQCNVLQQAIQFIEAEDIAKSMKASNLAIAAPEGE